MYNLKHPRENNDGVILGQLDLIQQLFSEPELSASGVTKDIQLREKQHTRLRLWKMLRELDTMPVFIPHIEEELYQLCKEQPAPVCDSCLFLTGVVKTVARILRQGSAKKKIRSLKSYLSKIRKEVGDG